MNTLNVSCNFRNKKTGEIVPIEVVVTLDVTSTTDYEICGPEVPEQPPTPTQDTDTVPASITVTPTSLNLLPDQTQQLTVVVRNKNGKILLTTPSFSSSNNSVATVNSTGLVTGGHTDGTCSIVVTAGNVSTSVGVVLTVPQPPPPPPPPPPPSGTGANEADLPKVLLNTARSNTPSLGTTWNVHSLADWNNALTNSVGGDVIVIDAGLVLVGNWDIVNKPTQDAGHWITVKKSGSLSPENTRIRFATAIADGYPIFRSNNVLPSISVNPQAGFWRFINILFDIDPTVTVAQSIFNIGNQVSTSNAADVPHDIILDCCCVHELDTQDCRKGVVFDGANLAYVDGDISNIKSLFDAQCITSTNGPGPFKVTNNYLESTGEQVAWGGATPQIANLISSDIEVRKNHFFKNPAWFNSQWLVKNHYESKNSQRAWIRGNIFENCWVAAQAGYSIVLWSANAGDAWTVTAHQTLEYNWIKNTTSVFQLSEWYNGTTTPAHHFTIKNNLSTGINTGISAAGVSRLFSINGVIDSLVFKHNSLFTVGDDIVWSPDASPNQIWQDNLLAATGPDHMFTSLGIGSAAWALVGGPGSLFIKNIVMGLAINQLADNFYPADLATIDCVGPTQGIQPAVTIPEIALAGGSPYHNAASDGTDVGVDAITLANELSGVA